MSENGQEKRETIADIVAEMRAYAKRCREENFCVAAECEEHYNDDDVEDLADRIEEAAKRESACRRSIKIPVKVVPTCNVARAQRRLELLRAEMSDMTNMPVGTKYCFSPQAIIDEIDDTLATQPRNCDVGSPEEQQNRFNRFCRPCADGCPFLECRTIVECVIKWEQTPYAGEGAGE